jgi:site-specific DNA recombinase
MHEKASKGMYPCHAPIGYRNNKESRGMDVDPLKAPFVQKMFEWYASGSLSLEAICRKLYGAGFTYQASHPKVSKSTLERILKNPIYTGRFDFLGKSYKGTHTPLVSEELFEVVQGVFKGHNKPRYRKHEFAFGGILTCAECGCSITAEIKKGRYIYYHCPQRRGDWAQGKAVREEVLQEQIADVVRRVTLEPETLAAIREAIESAFEDEALIRKESQASLGEPLEAVKTRMEKAYEDRLDGKLPEALWVKKSKEWERDIDRLERLLRGYNKAGHNFHEEGVFLLELSEKAYSMYEEQDPTARRELLNILCSNLILRDGKVTPEYRQPFDLLEVMKVEKSSLSQETPSEDGVSARWSGWRDSNPRPLAPEASALPD